MPTDAQLLETGGGRAMRILLIVSVTVPLILYAGVSWRMRELRLEDGMSHARQTVRMLEEHALRVLEAQQLIIDRVDQHIAGLDWQTIRQSPDIHELLKSVAALSPHVDGLWLVPPDGRTANSADFFPFPEVDTSDRDYFKMLEEEDILHVGQMIVGKTKGTLNFNLSRRRSPRETFDGLILVTASIDYFTKFWSEASRFERAVAGLFREDGEILARYPPVQGGPVKLQPESPLRQAIARSDDGVYRSPSSIDGSRRIYAYSRIGDMPVFIGFGVEEDEILAGWRHDLAWHGLIAVVAAALLGGAVLIAVKQSGRLQAAVLSWRTMAGELRREVDRRLRAEDVAVEQERLLSQLRDARSEREAILDNMVEGVAAYSADGEVIYCNDAARRILRLAPGEHPQWYALAAAGRLERPDGGKLGADDTPLRRLLRGEGVRHEELRLHVPDEPVPVICSFMGAPLLDQERRVTGAVLTFLDVTERREEEERRTLLLAELDHRVRNMLATISAMVRMTARAAGSREALVETLTGRIQAMARTHGLITRSGWRGAELGEIVRDEVHSYVGDERARMHGESRVMLPPKEAVDLALVLHELATNAAKHGAWSTNMGWVDIAWQSEGETPCVLRLVWRERGGPAVIAPRRSGFGTRLIRTAFNSQGASVDLRFEPEGVVCEMRIPLTSGLRMAARGKPTPSAQAAADSAADLRGLRVLLAEDEAVVQMELVSILQEAGATVIGPAATLEAALELAEEAACDCAVLDVNLYGEHSGPVAERLLARGIPVLLATGYTDLGMLPPAVRGLPRLQKPVTGSALVAWLSGQVGEARHAGDRRVAVTPGAGDAPANG